MEMLPTDNSTLGFFDLRHLAETFEAEHEAILETARQSGIRRDEPMGLLLSAMLQTQRRCAEASITTVAELSRIVANAQLAVEGNVVRQRQIQRETVELNGELRRSVNEAMTGARQERQDLHKDLVTVVLPQVRKALERPLVISEKRHNYTTLLSVTLVVVGILALTFFTGMFLPLWTDWRGSERLSDFQLALDRCLVAEPVHDAHGTRYCPTNSFLPRWQDPARADEGHAPPR